MSGISAYKVTPRQARRFIVRCMLAGLVPFLQGSPAIGKSAVVKSIADEYGLKLIDHRLSTSAPEDLTGLPRFKEDGTATFAPFDTFPTEGTKIPDGYQGWMIFLDEFNSASKMVQAAAYKLVLDKMVGLAKLHPNVVIVAAGNLTTDRAIVNPLSTAMQSRLITLEMILDHQEFMEDVALPQRWDSRIIAYLNYKKGALHDFRPDHNEKTFCSPRTWEFMNKLIKDQEVVEADAALYAGAITSGVAVEFITFTKVYATLPRFQEIVRDPNGIDVPQDAATRWATVTHLIEHVDGDSFDAVSTYIAKFTAEMRVIFFRGLMIQKPDLKLHPAWRRSLVDISRYLHDDLPTTTPTAVAA
jgi:MoxR-like ATPase